jgi:hypothetical protein
MAPHRSSGLSPQPTALISPEQVSRALMERDEQIAAEAPPVPAEESTGLNDTMSSTVSAILSPRVRTGHGVALRGLSTSLDARTLRAGLDAELDRTSSHLLVARTIVKRDTRKALRLFKKEKEKVLPKSLRVEDDDGHETARLEFRADTPLSKEALCRQGLTPQDIKPISYEQCLQHSGGNEKLADVRYGMLEKKRQAMLQRCSDERQLLAKIAAQVSRGHHARAPAHRSPQCIFSLAPRISLLAPRQRAPVVSSQRLTSLRSQASREYPWTPVQVTGIGDEDIRDAFLRFSHDPEGRASTHVQTHAHTHMRRSPCLVPDTELVPHGSEPVTELVPHGSDGRKHLVFHHT